MRIGGEFPSVLDAARNGEEWAWDTIYRTLAPHVRGYLRAKGAMEPDDLLGEVFLQIARGIGRFEGDESQFRSWVFMVAHNRVIDERRRAGRRPSDSTAPEDLDDMYDQPLAVLPDTESEVFAQLATDRVRELLCVLTPEQRDVLELRVIGGLTIDEIALAVGKPAGAVKALQRRALGALRRELASSEVSL